MASNPVPVLNMANDARDPDSAAEFQKQAGEKDKSALVEFYEFLRDNKRWWLVPIVVTLALVAGFLFLGSGPLAPFIYTLF